MENAPVAKANMKIYKTKNKFLRAKSLSVIRAEILVEIVGVVKRKL